jgi:hypothetical protein
MEHMEYMLIAVLICGSIFMLYLMYKDYKFTKKQEEERDKERIHDDEERSRNRKILDWFYDGGECPKCGCAESEISPEPKQCKQCGTWFNKSHKVRKCAGCGFNVEVTGDEVQDE